MKIVQLQFDDGGPYSLWDSTIAYAGPVSVFIDLQDEQYLIVLKNGDLRWKEEGVPIEYKKSNGYEEAFEKAKKKAQEIFEDFVKEYFVKE